jgi:S1-C subfamily serine protease
VNISFSSRLLALPLLALVFTVQPDTARGDEKVAEKGVKSAVWVLSKLEGNRYMTGSGVVIDTAKKIVVTSQHLIMDTKGVLVVFPKYQDGKVITERNTYLEALRTGQGVDATVFAEDKMHDLALLQVETIPADVPALKLVKDNPAPGDKVHSIGSAGNMGPVFAYAEGSVKQSVTLNWRLLMGVGKLPLSFSAKVVELSAVVNGGDIGGPLLSEKGNLAGVSSGVTSGNGGSCYIDVSEIKALLQSKMIDPQVAADDPGAPKPEAVAKMDPKKDPKAKDPKGKNNPKAKPEGQAKTTDPVKREAEASLKLDQAKKAEAGKALDLLRDVVKNYADTKAADEAKPLLDKAEAEKKEADAYIKLDLARDLEKSGNPAKARQRFQEIVKDYPGTKAAEEAQKLIDKK